MAPRSPYATGPRHSKFGPFLLASTQRMIEGRDPELDPTLAARFTGII